MTPTITTCLVRAGIALLAAVSLVGVRATLPARGAAAPGKRETKPQKRSVDLKGDKWIVKPNPGGRGRTFTLTGNVVILSEDTTLRTDAATYNEETGIARSPGKVQIEDAQNTLIGDTGVADYKKRTATAAGSVRITARPRPQDQNAPEGSLRREFKQPVLITCNEVNYNWRTRVAVATGDLTMRQQNRTVTADRGVYEGRNEKVTLTGNVRGVTTEGDDIRAPKATVVLTEGKEELILDGAAGVIKVDIDDDEETAPPAPGTPAPDPAAPPASPAPPAPAPTAPPAPASPTLPGTGPRP